MMGAVLRLNMGSRVSNRGLKTSKQACETPDPSRCPLETCLAIPRVLEALSVHSVARVNQHGYTSNGTTGA